MADEKSEEEPTLLDLLKQHIRLEVRTDDPDSQSNEPTQVDSHTVGT